MCFHQNRSLSTRAKGRGHTQQSQGRFHPECAISATAMRCVWPAGPRTISAHAGGTLFPGFQARVPFLPRLTSHGVMPTLQVEACSESLAVTFSPSRISLFVSRSTAVQNPAELGNCTQLHPSRPHWGRLHARSCDNGGPWVPRHRALFSSSRQTDRQFSKNSF